jgi:DNA-binding transcriptional regulator YhcF (GntR family)
MLSLSLNRRGSQPLADQIVAGIKLQVDDRHLQPGSKLPSIRAFAKDYNVSRFTVVEAYDRLVAMGYLLSRRGAGFYTAAASATPRSVRPESSDTHCRNEELVWLIRRLLEAGKNTVLAGGPWLPNSWLDEAHGRDVCLGTVSAYRRLAGAGGRFAARRHNAGTGYDISSPSRTLPVDAL